MSAPTTASGPTSEAASGSASANGGTREPLLSVSHLVKHFPITRGIVFKHQIGAVKAVNDISFDVLPGQTLGLVGESGCGKSTAARVITRLLDPTSGSIRFEGREIAGLNRAQLRPIRRDIQMIFQDPYEGLSVRAVEEIVALGDGTTRPSAKRKPRAGGHRSELDDLAARLGDRLDTRVAVALGRTRGKLSIDFASVDDLNRILALMFPDLRGAFRADAPTSTK